MAALGCGEDALTPSEPQPAAAVTSTALKILSFTQLSAGTHHTCGVTALHKAYCWGLNTTGQLGDGTQVQRPTPVAVVGGLEFLRVSAGDAHTCGITTANRAYCWGANDEGQLGNGSAFDPIVNPRPIAVAGSHAFRQISAGVEHSCAVTTTDVAYCWGIDGSGEVGAAGFGHFTPTLVAGGLKFRQVIAGAYHTCGATTAFKAYCWGTGAIGNGTLRSDVPAAVGGGRSFKMAVAGGGIILIPSEQQEDFLSCGIGTDDLAYCWSFLATPSPVPGGHKFRGINLGALHACAVTLWDKVFCWGYNAFGQLGNGTTSFSTSTKPVQVAGGLEFNSVTANPYSNHTCAVSTAFKAYCWGWNQNGELGDGTTTSRSVPTPVAGVP